MQEYEVSLLKLFTDIMLDETISDKVRQLRFYAHKTLGGQIEHYRKLGYVDRLLNSIAEKKIAMIQKATTKTEIEKIVRPHAPHFNGVDFVADEYLTPEEEMIAWSEASFRAPLSSIACKRYMKLFKEFFPEESERLKIGETV